MAGNFHGLNHEEAYGVFDTGADVGAFGADKQQSYVFVSHSGPEIPRETVAGRVVAALC